MLLYTRPGESSFGNWAQFQAPMFKVEQEQRKVMKISRGTQMLIHEKPKRVWFVG